MAEMTREQREQAAVVLEKASAFSDKMRGAMDLAVVVLREPGWIHTRERAPGPLDADNAGKVRAINAWLDEEEDGQVNNTLVTVRWEVVKSHPDRYVVWHALLRMPDEPVLPGVV